MQSMQGVVYQGGGEGREEVVSDAGVQGGGCSGSGGGGVGGTGQGESKPFDGQGSEQGVAGLSRQGVPQAAAAAAVEGDASGKNKRKGRGGGQQRTTKRGKYEEDELFGDLG